MADRIVTQDPTNPNVLKVNGPTLGPGNKILLSDLDATGAANGQAIVLTGGVWVPGSTASTDTASNLGAGNGVFSAKVGADFQFKSLVAGTNVTITPTANDLTIASTGGGLSAKFTSTDQVITSAGALTLPHGLGAIPTLFQIVLVNQIAELGFNPGDITPVFCQIANADFGASVLPDAVNLNIRYGASAMAFQIGNITTGSSTGITNANWKARFIAWS